MKIIPLLFFLFLVTTTQAQSKKELRKTILEQQAGIQLLDSLLKDADIKIIARDENLAECDKYYQSVIREKKQLNISLGQARISNQQLQTRNSNLKNELAHWEKYKKPMKKPKPVPVSNNPFDGWGGASGKGSGSGAFGTGGDGPAGPGPYDIGDGSGRKRLTDPNVGEISSKEDQTIYLRVMINAEGKVANVKNLSAKTTTTDGVLINKVMAVVQRDVLFDKKPGARLEQVVITIKITAN